MLRQCVNWFILVHKDTAFYKQEYQITSWHKHFIAGNLAYKIFPSKKATWYLLIKPKTNNYPGILYSFTVFLELVQECIQLYKWCVGNEFDFLFKFCLLLSRLFFSRFVGKISNSDNVSLGSHWIDDNWLAQSVTLLFYIICTSVYVYRFNYLTPSTTGQVFSTIQLFIVV